MLSDKTKKCEANHFIPTDPQFPLSHEHKKVSTLKWYAYDYKEKAEGKKWFMAEFQSVEDETLFRTKFKAAQEFNRQSDEYRNEWQNWIVPVQDSISDVDDQDESLNSPSVADETQGQNPDDENEEVKDDNDASMQSASMQ